MTDVQDDVAVIECVDECVDLFRVRCSQSSRQQAVTRSMGEYDCAEVCCTAISIHHMR